MLQMGPAILIVEDEYLLRLDSAETIEKAGFEVIQAGNADEAILILEARPDIHVVFTDIQMPGSMDWLKLARFVRPVAPDQDRAGWVDTVADLRHDAFKADLAGVRKHLGPLDVEAFAELNVRAGN
jgi:CheY-like chemotaxis protein